MQARSGLHVGFVAGLASLVIACRGKVLGTVELHEPGTAKARFVATTTNVQLWADIEMKWSGPKTSEPEVFYEVDVHQGGRALGHVSCSTLDRDGRMICGGRSKVMGTHDADCEIALACRLPAFATGELELTVTGRTGTNVLAVKKMSLNVREE